MPAVRAIFAGGGTGGHLYPAIAIAEELKILEPRVDILFIGTRKKIEARVVPQRGFRFRAIWISGFHRSLRISNLLFPLKVIVGLAQTLRIVRQFRPHVVVGTGGYVSGPVVYMATLLGIPTLIQEQNSFPGETTRFLAPRVNEVHVTFEQSKRFLTKARKLVVSGNPVRGNLGTADRDGALKSFGFDPRSKRQTILVVGGSLGAHSINLAVMNVMEDLVRHDLRIIWQTGADDLPGVQEAASIFPAGTVWVGAFIDRMDYAYAASDLVVCRAGATTIAELNSLGKAAVMIPYPHAAANHQEENALALVESGAAVMVRDHEAMDKLLPAVLAALEPSIREVMCLKSRRLGKPEAARILAQRVLALARI